MKLFILCLIVLALLVSISAFLFFPFVEANTSKVNELILQDTIKNVGELPLGKHAVTFNLENHSSLPRRIVGYTDYCLPNVCLGPQSFDHLSLPPGVVTELVCEVLIRKPGPFSIEMEVHVEDRGLRTIMVCVKGVGIATEGKSDADTQP